ncbi:MAG: hypothetical protein NTV34_08545, partial [Proteobacteria bacterium]|nr:hypothetical protein [Pseudomonadota bacterium]
CFFGPGKWVRANSTLAVLIITDEDNCHIDVEKGYGCSGAADKEGAYLTNYLRTIRQLGSEARVYGLFWHPSQAQSQCSTAMKSANIIADVVAATSGTWGSICDADYTATLTKISSDVAQILKADFSLKSIPDPGTLKITVAGQNWTEYTLAGTVVHFTKTPPKGSAIAVSYVSGSAGIITNEFDLPSDPADGSLSATVGSTSAGTVTWDGGKRKAILGKTPADGTVVTITYKENTPLKDTFEIATDANVEYLKITVNGKSLNNDEYQYTPATGAVKFKSPPPEAAKIDVSWRGSKKLG